MTLTSPELEFLAAWAREEWEPACYRLHAHQLQLGHGVAGASLFALIKAWTRAEGKKDQDILNLGSTAEPPWPWATNEELQARLTEAIGNQAKSETPAA